ncbi:hypothetical protein HTT03_08300 [Sulfitobacter sp. S0837]|uniref:hypothetical protein n=1 Tax=Sulfitobacter maritimus TaxID=2741719 RepID=UPI001581DC4B|nr:hypothetical protein [Sulfitobacter maritimus]NUH65287.1 hypothetical protein [Sulfitobacter maritimus]
MTFLIVFLVGPWAFRRLTQAVPSPRVMRAVPLLALSAFLMALALRIGFASHWGDSLWLSAAVTMALWAAWIAVIALVVQALRRADPRLSMQRWTGALGAAGTTVPWFGLALADLLRGP